MTEYVNNDQLLIHCSQDNLVGAAARWYNQLSRARISSWKDLTQAFMQQYNHVTDMTPDRITLQNMEKKPNENFRQYEQRWRGVAMQVQPPLLEKETTITTKSFADIVMAGEMIENAIKGGKIEGEVAKRSAPRRKDNEVNNTSSFNSKAVTVSQPKTATGGQQSTQRQESRSRQNSGRIQFTPIPVTFRKAVERFIKMGVVRFDSTSNVENWLPDHGNQGVNAIDETREGIIMENVAEVRMPLRVIWKEMVKRGMITSEKEKEEMRNYCEFHGKEGHETQNSKEFKALVQGFIDNKELQVFEGSSYKREINALEDKQQEISRPRIIISLPGNNEVVAQTRPKVVIHKPVSFPYKDNKRVPWSYDCHVSLLEKGDVANASNDVQIEGSHTRSGKWYDTLGVRDESTKTRNASVEKGKEVKMPVKESVKEEEAKEFLKFLKHSEYSVVESHAKQPLRYQDWLYF
ncbi:uncharacterized protein LOC108466207 [Gossypium arboreum]|uniref:uncharacterized protein LOC108466207 n=1 Tax=Gossypium arboreum TaxID=29729 RepID=UPI0022F18F56|nr:uncharacterized protein LOC108466207 [Gossypium arboreum]